MAETSILEFAKSTCYGECLQRPGCQRWTDSLWLHVPGVLGLHAPNPAPCLYARSASGILLIRMTVYFSEKTARL